MDGGATFAGLLSAGAALVGYKQQKEDDSELVDDEEELERLRKNLGEACISACAAHSAITAAWGQPLSLFKAEGSQLQVQWLKVLEFAQALVEKAAELEDLADVYDAQLHLAITQHRSLRRTPVHVLEGKLDEISLLLTSQIPAVVFAKEANTHGDVTRLQSALAARCHQDSEAEGKSLTASEELPLAILQDRKLLGELWRVGPGRMEVLARAIARRTGRTPMPEGPTEYSSYVADYL